jgi:hypothetical protein
LSSSIAACLYVQMAAPKPTPNSSTVHLQISTAHLLICPSVHLPSRISSSQRGLCLAGFAAANSTNKLTTSTRAAEALETRPLSRTTQLEGVLDYGVGNFRLFLALCGPCAAVSWCCHRSQTLSPVGSEAFSQAIELSRLQLFRNWR